MSALYLTANTRRVSANYSTLHTKVCSPAYFWIYVRAKHPDLTGCDQVLPVHARGFVPWAL